MPDSVEIPAPEKTRISERSRNRAAASATVPSIPPRYQPHPGRIEFGGHAQHAAHMSAKTLSASCEGRRSSGSSRRPRRPAMPRLRCWLRHRKGLPRHSRGGRVGRRHDPRCRGGTGRGRRRSSGVLGVGIAVGLALEDLHGALDFAGAKYSATRLRHCVHVAGPIAGMWAVDLVQFGEHRCGAMVAAASTMSAGAAVGKVNAVARMRCMRRGIGHSLSGGTRARRRDHPTER